ncbi:hypothetical protein JRC49_10880 [Clostridiales bacterium FE2011]|nr:hypothetical protein JRC49_10880 [Clostridiales bacterium FE2011]
MHVIDKYIKDIEPRIQEIIEKSNNLEGATLQTSLAAYGWILLDSWIAWRTLRYLLRCTSIDDAVQKRWVQTPSSYRSDNLRAAWNFTDSAIDYLASETDSGSFQHLIDSIIQPKRNSSAHYSKIGNIIGTDIKKIKDCFKAFSTVFLAYEIDSFINRIKTILSENGYKNFNIILNDTPITNIKDNVSGFAKPGTLIISCTKSDDAYNYEIKSNQEGCQARKVTTPDSEWYDVYNETIQQYYLWDNKGFYLDAKLFCDTVMTCWSK